MMTFLGSTGGKVRHRENGMQSDRHLPPGEMEATLIDGYRTLVDDDRDQDRPRKKSKGVEEFVHLERALSSKKLLKPL